MHSRSYAANSTQPDALSKFWSIQFDAILMPVSFIERRRWIYIYILCFGLSHSHRADWASMLVFDACVSRSQLCLPVAVCFYRAHIESVYCKYSRRACWWRRRGTLTTASARNKAQSKRQTGASRQCTLARTNAENEMIYATISFDVRRILCWSHHSWVGNHHTLPIVSKPHHEIVRPQNIFGFTYLAAPLDVIQISSATPAIVRISLFLSSYHYAWVV